MTEPERITSVRDVRAWIARDIHRYAEDAPVRAKAGMVLRTPQLRWLMRLRLTELVVNRWGGAPSAFLRWRLQAAAVRLGYTIPVNVFGPGLKLPHWGTIVVSPDARVGPDCTLHPSTCLGLLDGRAPRLGERVYIGPGAKLFGGITVGDHAAIGANAVVNRDVAAGDVVAGVPARPIRRTEDRDYR